MRITAKEIKKGMTIKVSGIYDSKNRLLNMINGAEGFGSHTEEEKKSYQIKIDNNLTKGISRGGIKKDSPILKIEGINFDHSYSYMMNGRTITINSIVLKTDKGDLVITTRQKVELID